MQVLLLTDADAFAGTERHILELAIALRDSGDSSIGVLIGCPENSPLAKRAHVAQIAIVPLPFSGGLVNGSTLRALRRLLGSGRVDILHAHNGRAALHAALAATLARRGRVVTTQHFLQPAHTSRSGIKARVSDAIHRFVNKKVAAHVAISRAVETQMLARGEADAARLHVVLNALPCPDASTLRAATEVREEFGVAMSTPLLVCAARLEREKSMDVLIESFSQIEQDFRCLIAGEGKEKANLQGQIARVKLQDKVQLLGFRDDVLSLINTADVFVLPSEAEPFGLVLLEAMALFKPIVAVNGGGPPEIVRDGSSGVLVPPHDAPAMAAALKNLLGNSQARQEMGNAGRAIFDEKFRPQRMAREMLAVYQKAMQ